VDEAEKFLEAVARLEDVSNTLTPERAHREFDETTLQVFWKQWPDLAAWTGSLWRMLSDELAQPSTPHLDPDMDETGAAG